MIVQADLRWPVNTGIGLVQRELVARAPAGLDISDLCVPGRIGSPLSPFRLTRALARNLAGSSIFWNPGFIPPSRPTIRSVVTVHDLTHLHYYSAMHRFYYHLLLKSFYRDCDAIICVSDFTRNEFLNWSSISPDRVHTVYNGVSPDFFAQQAVAQQPFQYVLYVGNRRRYKNLRYLIAAFSASSLPRDGVRLMLTGDVDPILQEVAAESGLKDELIFSGTVTERELSQLYRGARLLAFVSLYEGFGLPILEAMAAGIPVLTSNVAAMPEVAGGAALLVDPSSVEEIRNGLEILNYNEAVRLNLVATGKVNAQKFNWDKCASCTWDIVREVAVRK